MKNKNIVITALVSLALVIIIVLGTNIKNNKTVKNDAESLNKVESNVINDGGQSDKSKADSKEESKNNDNSNEGSSSSGGKYKDGEYKGSAVGYNGDIKVSVKVESGQIKDITILESSDDAEYFDKAKSLISDMLNKQSTDVGVVSGATYSSNGIKGAVKTALASGGN